jgi:hypothetical protein
MDDSKLEERLRQALRTEGDSIHLGVTPDKVQLRLRLRQTERSNRRLILGAAAALVLAVGAASAALLSNHGTVPPVGASPSPSARAAESAPSEALFEILGDYGGDVVLDVRSTESEPSYNSSFETGGGIYVPAVMGGLPAATRYVVTFACLGPLPVEVSTGIERGVEGGVIAGKTSDDCRTGKPRQVTVNGLGDQPAELFVMARSDTIWHVVVALPRADSPSVAPPSPADSVGPMADIAPYPGWQLIGRLSGPHGHAQATVSGKLPGGVSQMIVSAACNGLGSLAITMTSNEDLAVDCPTTSITPTRQMSYVGDGTQFEVHVLVSGNVRFQVLVEGSDVVLPLPTVSIRHGLAKATMRTGCVNSISLAWGYTAFDDCATTVAATPLETLELSNQTHATVAIDGWTITAAEARCGRIVTSSGAPSLFEAMAQCRVSAALTHQTIIVKDLPATTKPWVVELQLTAKNGAGDSFSAPFYAYVHVH